MLRDKAISEEYFEKIKDLPTIDRKGIYDYERNQRKVLRQYGQVEWTEILSLDSSIIKWLKPRLTKLLKAWEKTVNLEDAQEKAIYSDVIEMIELSNYIIEEKWWEETEDLSPQESKDFMDRFIKTEDGNFTLEPYPEEEQKLWDEYSRIKTEKEDNAKNRYTELLAKNFWQLWC